MSGHGHHDVEHHEEDQSINTKVGVFFICVILTLFVIGMIN
jgi:hypothetical protein